MEYSANELNNGDYQGIFLPRGALQTALIRSSSPSDISFASIFIIKALGASQFSALIEKFNEGLGIGLDFPILLQDIKSNFLNLRSKEQSILCRFILDSSLDLKKHNDILEIFLESDSILLKRSLVKRLDYARTPMFEKIILTFMNQGVQDALRKVIFDFEVESIFSNLNIIIENLGGPDLNFKDWMVRKLFIRVSATHPEIVDLASSHWPTYCYLCAKCGLHIDDEICFDKYLDYIKMLSKSKSSYGEYDNHSGLIIWAYGIMGKKNVLDRLIGIENLGLLHEIEKDARNSYMRDLYNF